jgi:hypothetical protein
MTDRELLEAFLKQTGLDGKMVRWSKEVPVVERAGVLTGTKPLVAVTLNEGEGYTGFFVRFFFDMSGKFESFGVWE